LKNQTESIKAGKTFLRSTSHLMVRETKGNRLRSLLVGIQFGVMYLPWDLISVSLYPFVKNIVLAFYYFFSNAWFVLVSAFQVVWVGFEGYLEASEEVVVDSQSE